MPGGLPVGVGGGFGFDSPANRIAPPSAGWTALGGASVVPTSDGSRVMTLAASAGDNWKIEYKTLNAAINYTAEAYIDTLFDTPALSLFAGIVVMDNAGAFIEFGNTYEGGSPGQALKMVAIKWSGLTTYSADYFRRYSFHHGHYKWFRIRDDGTNRYYEASFDGITWMTMHSTLRTDFITPTRIGYGINFNTGPGNAKLVLRSLKEY